MTQPRPIRPTRSRDSQPPQDAGAQARTIEDFGEQWTHYGSNEGYYASGELFQDICGPLITLSDFEGARVADLGSGTGRIVRMLLDAGAARVIAVEPSSGIEALRENLADCATRVEVIHGPGEAVPTDRALDFVTCIGVLPFIPDPQPVLRAALEALRPGGRLLIWLYAREGMGPYLAVVTPLRAITTRLPHAALDALCELFTSLLDAYIFLCRTLPLPLRDYMTRTLARVSRDKRKLTIYDQLNPSYARYDSREEVEEMLSLAGFERIRLHHRRGYSWSAVASRPE